MFFIVNEAEIQLKEFQTLTIEANALFDQIEIDIGNLKRASESGMFLVTEEAKGIFVRIIESIKNFFKTIWKRILSLFNLDINQQAEQQQRQKWWKANTGYQYSYSGYADSSGYADDSEEEKSKQEYEKKRSEYERQYKDYQYKNKGKRNAVFVEEKFAKKRIRPSIVSYNYSCREYSLTELIVGSGPIDKQDVIDQIAKIGEEIEVRLSKFNGNGLNEEDLKKETMFFEEIRKMGVKLSIIAKNITKAPVAE
jgi:hypothetical protein